MGYSRISRETAIIWGRTMPSREVTGRSVSIRGARALTRAFVLLAALMAGGVAASAVEIPPDDSRPFVTRWRNVSVLLNSVHFQDARTGWAVGNGGTILVMDRDFGVNLAPIVAEFQPPSAALGGLSLHWRVQDENPQHVTCHTVERSALEPGDWLDVKAEPHPIKGAPDSFEVLWNPKGIAEGTKIYYRITCKDRFTQHTTEIPEGFDYQPLLARLVARWDSQSGYVQAAIVTPAAIAFYLLICWVLVYLWPRALLFICTHLPLQGLAGEAAPDKVSGLVLQTVVRLTLLPWFATHRRVLDVWVRDRADKALRAFSGIDEVGRRRGYVPLPIRVEEPGDRTTIPEPKPEELRRYFKSGRTVIAIAGDGGAGKSTLAFRVGHWAVSEDPDERIAAHRMIPVLIARETTNLREAVAETLRRMLEPEHTVQDFILDALLRRRRLLVIVDALSERTSETQEHVWSVHGKFPINALIITTRRLPASGEVPVTHWLPERLDRQGTVLRFVSEYLAQEEADQAFDEDEYRPLVDQLLALARRGARRGGVTPLMVKLFVDNARHVLGEGGRIQDLEPSVPRSMLTYLRRRNPQDPKTPNYVKEEVLVMAAQALGNVCLGESFIPRDFSRKAAEDALTEGGINAGDADVIQRLVDNGVLSPVDVAGAPYLRFEFDSLAEYLAAMHHMHRLGGNEVGWNRWLGELREISGYPESISGFLNALEDCIETFGAELGVPDLNLDWRHRLDEVA